MSQNLSSAAVVIGALRVNCFFFSLKAFQYRKDGSVDFYRGWHDYELGFGLSGSSEYWLGMFLFISYNT